METNEANESIRQWLLDNYELVMFELRDLISQRDNLLESHSHLTRDIKDQFRWAACSVIINLIATSRADIPGEDVNVYVRSLDLNHFLTLDLKSDKAP